GVVLANWTTKAQAAVVCAATLGERVTVDTSGREVSRATAASTAGGYSIALPPLACVLIAEETRS
ncbi:MAG: hypothetical protein GW802_39595, partial [Armatimonadetes bacterium]|nr:hypothetical protein [Armatimonadota bacterium]